MGTQNVQRTGAHIHTHTHRALNHLAPVCDQQGFKFQQGERICLRDFSRSELCSASSMFCARSAAVAHMGSCICVRVFCAHGRLSHRFACAPARRNIPHRKPQRDMMAGLVGVEQAPRESSRTSATVALWRCVLGCVPSVPRDLHTCAQHAHTCTRTAGVSHVHIHICTVRVNNNVFIISLWLLIKPNTHTHGDYTSPKWWQHANF